MKPKPRWIHPLLLLAMLAPGASALAQPENPNADDPLASRMREGWKRVAPGVLQRQREAGRVQTFAFGPEGSRWAIREIERRLAFLEREHRAYPNEDVRRAIRSLRQTLSRLRKDMETSRDEPLSSMMEKCTPDPTANADVYPLTPASGVGASASAYFNPHCGYTVETYAYAYARASANGKIRTVIQESPQTGINVASTAAASVAGTSNCLAEAYAFARYAPGNIFESDSATDTQCTGTGMATPAVSIGHFDAVPAATLLLPYFEVDLNNPNGITTLFSVNNASNMAVLAHVTLWTDQSVPVLNFDVYLTGFDVLTINMRDIIVNGSLPVTASAGQDPTNTISPQGPVSQDINFASCTGVLPYTNPAVSASFRSHLQAWFTGNQSPATGNCAGSRIRDGIARGYVTIDTVNACSNLFPSSPGYMALLTAQNVLWGDYFFVNSGANLAHGETLVHIEACATCFVPGDHTFYGRYNGGSAADQREALPTTLATRFINGGAFNDGTDFLVWREGNQAAAGYSCAAAGPAAWYPLDAVQIVVFDEEENPVQQNTCPSGDPTCTQIITIPNEAQRVDVAEDLLAPFDFGWVYLNLQHSKPKPYQDPYAQAWLMVVMDSQGRFSVGFDGILLDNANRPITTPIPVPVP